MALPEQLSASKVRRLAMEALRQFGGAAGDDFSETIVLRDGNYIGRRFDASSGSALWLIDDERLSIYDLRGREVQALSTARHIQPLRRAA
jgi:hypothetical protein